MRTAGGIGQRKHGIHGGVIQPPGRDHGTASKSVRQGTSGQRRHHLDHVQARPEKRDPEGRHSGVTETQEEKCIGRVAERENGDDCKGTPHCRRQERVRIVHVRVRRGAKGCVRVRWGAKRCGFGNHQDDGNDNRTGNDRESEQRAVFTRIEVEEDGGQQRTEDSARMIHRAVESVDPAALFRSREIGEHRVTRRAADAFAQAVGKADPEHVRPRRCDGDERTDRRGDAIADEDQPPGTSGLVGQPSGDNLQRAVRRLRNAFDDAERHRPGAEHFRQKERQQRVDHLGRGIGEKAHPPEQPYRTGETERARPRGRLLGRLQRRLLGRLKSAPTGGVAVTPAGSSGGGTSTRAERRGRRGSPARIAATRSSDWRAA